MTHFSSAAPADRTAGRSEDRDPAPESRRLGLLARYGRSLALTFDAGRIYHLVVDGACLLSGAHAAALCLYPAGGRPATPAAAHNLAEPFLDRLCALQPQAASPDATLLATLLNAPPAGIPLTDLPEAAAPPDFVTLARAAGVGRLLALALAGDHEVTGVLFLAGAAGTAFSEEDIAAVGLLVDQAGVARRNTQLYLQTAHWAQRLAVLQAVGTEIGASLNLREVLQTVVRRAVDLAEASIGRLALWHSGAQVLRVAVAHRPHQPAERDRRQYRLGEGLLGQAAASRRPVVVRDYQTWEQRVADGALDGVHAGLALPLVWQEDLLGVLMIGDHRPDRVFSDEDLTLLSLLAQQAAGAVANARLYQRAQQKLHQLNVLQETSRAIIEQLDYDQILYTVLRHASELLSTGMGAVFVPSEAPGQLQIRAAVGLPEEYTRRARVPLGSEGVGQAVVLGKPVAVADLRAGERADDPANATLPPDLRSLLAVPLISQQTVHGGLCIYSRQPRTWTASEAELLFVFASQAANAMHNAGLFERLRAEKATLLTTIQSMNDGIIVIDTAGRVILANPVADRLFGVPFTASGGLFLPGLLRQSPAAVRTAARHPLAEVLQSVLADGGTLRAEVTVERPGSPALILEHSLLPILGGDGSRVGAVAVFHDITELRKLDRLKTDFISTVSHELRTPLTSIKGFLKLTLVEELGPLTPQQRECLNVADEEADRLTHLINDLLDISRIEAGRLQFTWEQVDPAELITQVLQLLQPQADERGLTMRDEAPPGLPTVRADRQRLFQVLTNLVENAIKFTPRGGQVRVGAAVEGETLAVWVSDTGVGIPPHALPRLFERFYQVEGDGGRRAHSGSGLGLAIAKQLVELHGGHIGVSSRPGAGTTFRFTLPLGRAGDAPDVAVQAPG